MENPKTILSDDQLIKEIKNMRTAKCGKLEIVKYVYDNSDKMLKDAKEFVDNN